MSLQDKQKRKTRAQHSNQEKCQQDKQKRKTRAQRSYQESPQDKQKRKTRPQRSIQEEFHPGPARKLSTNLYDIYQC